jgi:hypothetical protein
MCFSEEIPYNIRENYIKPGSLATIALAGYTNYSRTKLDR